MTDAAMEVDAPAPEPQQQQEDELVRNVTLTDDRTACLALSGIAETAAPGEHTVGIKVRRAKSRARFSCAPQDAHPGPRTTPKVNLVESWDEANGGDPTSLDAPPPAKVWEGSKHVDVQKRDRLIQKLRDQERGRLKVTAVLVPVWARSDVVSAAVFTTSAGSSPAVLVAPLRSGVTCVVRVPSAGRASLAVSAMPQAASTIGVYVFTVSAPASVLTRMGVAPSPLATVWTMSWAAFTASCVVGTGFSGLIGFCQSKVPSSSHTTLPSPEVTSFTV